MNDVNKQGEQAVAQALSTPSNGSPQQPQSNEIEAVNDQLNSERAKNAISSKARGDMEMQLFDLTEQKKRLNIKAAILTSEMKDCDRAIIAVKSALDKL